MPAAFLKRIQRAIGLNRSSELPTAADWDLVTQVKNRSLKLEGLTDRELTQSAVDLQECFTGANSTEDALHTVNAVAHVREAVRRVTGKCYFRVQLLAGIILSRNCVAEMATGEGKTLTSAIPGFLNSLRYRNVHVGTPNAYLAQRDFEELKPVYELLGASVGLLPEKPDPAKTRNAYESSITYGAGYGFGFDFLRDELTRRQQPQMRLGQATTLSLRGKVIQATDGFQKGHDCSLIDEIDSVLLDEAMTPLILSVASPQKDDDKRLFELAGRLAKSFQQGVHFQWVGPQSVIHLTEAGINEAERAIGVPSGLIRSTSAALASRLSSAGSTGALRNFLKRPWLVYVENALQARYRLRVDVDYVIRNREVQLVDQKTGRIFADRSWRSGLHQAVEEFQGVPITDEKTSAGRITRQSYYRMYQALCGMTGTATGAESEFKKIYGLKTVRVPLNKPSLRIELPNRYFANRDAKLAAVVRETRFRIQKGQPVLIGSRTIADSEVISDMLRSDGIEHVVLNGKQDEAEASIVRDAGRSGRVTVATNMAGRGTDIKPDQAAVEAGGLHVIGVERHESRRVDNQLAGRAARAGSPGSYQFLISADDDLVNTNNSRLAKHIVRSCDQTGESHRSFDLAVFRLQSECEQAAFQTRLLMMLQDNQMHELLKNLCYRTDST